MRKFIQTILMPRTYIERFMGTIKRLCRGYEKYAVKLTRDERRRAVKFRAGGEVVIKCVGPIAREKNVSLTISVDDMESRYALAESISPMIKAVAELHRLLVDTQLRAYHESWYAATAYYTALARIQNIDGEIQDALRPAVEFFALGSRERVEDAAMPGLDEDEATSDAA